LVLGKSLKPRAFGNSDIPVSYKGQKRAWVTKEIFSEWFHREFVPSVRRKMRELNLSPKALLLLDNAPGHPTELSSDDDQISVLFLPPNCTPLLQPMDQHVIQAIKLFYRKNLLQQIVESEDPIPQTLKSINLKHVMFSLNNAWKNVSTDLIKKSWNKVWPPENITGDLSDYDDEDDIPLARLARRMTEVEKIPEIDNGLQVICKLGRKLDENLQNNEIEEWVFGRNEPSDIIVTDDAIIQEQLGDIDSESTDEEPVDLVLVKHGEAVLAFDKCIQWAAQNNISDNRLALLNELRGQALTLEKESIKQTKITHFFTKSTENVTT
jgi:DDE superfamily endonuclease